MKISAQSEHFSFFTTKFRLAHILNPTQMCKSLITRKRLVGFVWLAHKPKFDDESIGAGPEIRKLAVQQNISGTQKVGVARNFFVLISPFFLILDPNMVWHLSPFINPFVLPKIPL